MKNNPKIISFIFFVLFMSSLNAQERKVEGVIFKTRVLTTFAAFNPNLFVEIVGKKHSVEFEAMWRNRDWANKGGEWSFGRFYPTTGFSAGIGIKRYFVKKRVSPDAWYFQSTLRYNSSRIDNMEEVGFHGDLERRITYLRRGPELGLFCGGQFLVHGVSFDLGLGAQFYWRETYKTLLSGYAEDYYVNGVGHQKHLIVRPFLYVKIGGYWKFKKAESSQ